MADDLEFPRPTPELVELFRTMRPILDKADRCPVTVPAHHLRALQNLAKAVQDWHMTCYSSDPDVATKGMCDLILALEEYETIMKD